MAWQPLGSRRAASCARLSPARRRLAAPAAFAAPATRLRQRSSSPCQPLACCITPAATRPHSGFSCLLMQVIDLQEATYKAKMADYAKQAEEFVKLNKSTKKVRGCSIDDQ